ncbi:MAG: S49 family peptidase [Bacteroidetes bacterium]|nr:S49 family peptidase [Bacteroidota bacterium]
MIPLKDALEILSAKWLIDESYVQSQMPLLYAFLQGQQIDAKAFGASEKPYIIKGDSNINTCNKWDLEYEGDDIPYNSIAVIPIQGPIMSYDTMGLMRALAMAQDSDRIIAVLLVVNSPGGMVMQIDNLAGNIAGFKKPIITYVIGQACSAASWIISGTRRIIASSQMDSFGSVGVMCSAQDFSGMFEKLGIKELTWFARKSTEKGQPIRSIMDKTASKEEKDKRTTELLDELDFINEIFHQEIMKNLKIKADSPVFTGKVFMAKEAIQMGLCHEINTFQYALDYAHREGMRSLIIN